MFGASLDDTGNACNAAPTSCPPPPYATGRFSNGPLCAEVMAERLNARIVPSRTGGLNFAFAGARTGPISGTTQAMPNMVQQADLYLQNAPTAGHDLTLHVVNAATVGNDINDALVQARTNPNAPAAIIAGAVQNITSIVTRLHGGGARHVLLLNSTDIGRVPQVSALGAATAGLAMQLSSQCNTALNAALPSLRAATPGLTIYVVDLGALAAHHPDLRQRLIILTGGALTGEDERFLARDDVTVLSKPVRLDDLDRTMAVVLTRRGPPRAADVS